MQIKYENVIADASCFILLDNIGELQLLKLLFGRVITTSIIAAEFGSPFPEWVMIKRVEDVVFQSSLDVDPGEASAIALAKELQPSLIILDDAKGRAIARKMNINFTGTLGILLKAKKSGIIPLVRPILEKIQLTNFRYSITLFQEILNLSDE